MRAIYTAYVIALLSLFCGGINEFNALNMADQGYPLIPYGETTHVNQTVMEYNNTVSQYGLDRVPSQAGTNYFLGTGGTLLSTYNAFNGVFLYTTLGFSDFVQNAFPSMPLTLKLGLDIVITMNNLLAIISFLRGVALRWM